MKERKGFGHRDVFLFVCFCLGVSEALGFFLVILWLCSIDPLLLLVCVCVCVCVCERERERERERGMMRMEIEIGGEGA